MPTPTIPTTTEHQPAAPPTPPRVLLTVEAAAERLSISRTRMYALLKDGAITSVRVGRLRRIPADALHDFTARLVASQNRSASRAA